MKMREPDFTLETTLNLLTGRIEEVDYKAPVFLAYAIHSADDFPRWRGSSRVLYVGEGKGNRLRDLFKGKHPSVRSFYRLGLPSSAKSRAPLPVRILVWNHASKRAAEMHEALLMGDEAEKCGELPPGNAKWEGWWQAHVLRAFARVQWGENAAQAGALYDYPADEPFCTILDVYGPVAATQDGRTWRGSLVWTWSYDGSTAAIRAVANRLFVFRKETIEPSSKEPRALVEAAAAANEAGFTALQNRAFGMWSGQPLASAAAFASSPWFKGIVDTEEGAAGLFTILGEPIARAGW